MALALLLDSPVYWRSLPGMESWIKAATVVKEFRGFRKPVLLTTARAAPIPSPHAAVFAQQRRGRETIISELPAPRGHRQHQKGMRSIARTQTDMIAAATSQAAAAEPTVSAFAAPRSP